jgi:DNA-binding transcriptional LysR family regulator
MRMGKLRLFCSLVETKSFSRAAYLNYVTQSAITQMFQGLERAAGQLLATTHQPFRLTHAGHYP